MAEKNFDVLIIGAGPAGAAAAIALETPNCQLVRWEKPNFSGTKFAEML